MTENNQKIVPVILSGGSGTRLWPMSVPERPKQFLALTGERTMFEQTLLRAANADLFAPPVIVANARHAELIEEQLGSVGIQAGGIILEPCARNTAPAIALAAVLAGSAPMLVMPSDHVIADEPAFLAAVMRALPLLADGWLVTFGIKPDGPETGYGYIRIGEAVGTGVNRVDQFIEKPGVEAAQAMLAEGNHAWNGGIFLFTGDAYIAALETHAPEMLIAVRDAMAGAERSGARILPNETAFASSPSDSVDYAVMEKADRVAVAPVAMGWSDVGSWDALFDLDSGLDDANVLRLDTVNSLIRSDGVKIHTVGVSDLIVIASGNDVLIVPRGRSQDVKAIVEALKAPQVK
jgi:mannose-1-phosphate guanylyltransferase